MREDGTLVCAPNSDVRIPGELSTCYSGANRHRVSPTRFFTSWWKSWLARPILREILRPGSGRLPGGLTNARDH